MRRVVTGAHINFNDGTHRSPPKFHVTARHRESVTGNKSPMSSPTRWELRQSRTPRIGDRGPDERLPWRRENKGGEADTPNFGVQSGLMASVSDRIISLGPYRHAVYRQCRLCETRSADRLKLVKPERWGAFLVK